MAWAFVNHIDQTPMTLIPTRESNPRDHKKAEYRLEKRKIREPRPAGILPVAGMPLYEGEEYIVNRSKNRLVLILSEGGPEIEKKLVKDQPNYQRYPTVLVAPFYSSYKFSSLFVERVKQCAYPNYFCDCLPERHESILRLDQLQPVGRNPDSIDHTQYCLSDEAFKIIEELIRWLVYECLPEGEESYIRTFWELLEETKNIASNSTPVTEA